MGSIHSTNPTVTRLPLCATKLAPCSRTRWTRCSNDDLTDSAWAGNPRAVPISVILASTSCRFCGFRVMTVGTEKKKKKSCIVKDEEGIGWNWRTGYGGVKSVPGSNFRAIRSTVTRSMEHTSQRSWVTQEHESAFGRSHRIDTGWNGNKKKPYLSYDHIWFQFGQSDSIQVVQALASGKRLGNLAVDVLWGGESCFRCSENGSIRDWMWKVVYIVWESKRQWVLWR